jgi:hypothetical protein
MLERFKFPAELEIKPEIKFNARGTLRKIWKVILLVAQNII